MVQRGRAFPPEEATRIIIEAAKGLGHAHRRGIIHRDVKPGNIMLTSDGLVKVSDFGLARDVMRADDIVQPGTSAGTPHYMAPEQAEGEEPTAASDLYALGATYYAILTGRPPYEADDLRKIVEMRRQGPLPDPRRYIPNLPPGVYRVIEKALAVDPADRFQTASEVIEVLERIEFGKLPTDALSAQEVSAQIGQMTPEDRGSHLSDVIDRAARRLEGRTSEDLTAIGISGEARRFSGRKLVVLIVIALLAFIGGMAVLAFMLSK